MPVSAVFENLESGATVDEIADWFDLTRDQITAVLEFAARSLAFPIHCKTLKPPKWLMRILFDHSTPAPLMRFLPDHAINKAKDAGWDQLANGELLSAAEQAGFDILLTADQSIRYPQNLPGRSIALVVLSAPNWPRVRLHTEKILAAVNAATPGSYAEVDMPYP
jgi:hypothetical protein